MTSSVQDIDMGWNEIQAALELLSRSQITVGIHDDGSADEEGVTVATYAAFNEFGTSRAPARPFVRPTFDKEGPNWLKMLNKRLGKRPSRRTVQQALRVVGLMAQRDIDRMIVALKVPANAPATIARKKSSNPLIDTGRMRQSVTFQVTHGSRKG